MALKPAAPPGLRERHVAASRHRVFDTERARTPRAMPVTLGPVPVAKSLIPQEFCGAADFR